jgi:uncharacterized protein YbaR (Trm112 family)
MKSQIKLSNNVIRLLQCPVCKAKLEVIDEQFQCKNIECNIVFPIINGIPVLINETNSVFSINDFVSQKDTFFNIQSQNMFKETIKRIMPDISRNIKGKENYDKLAKLLLKQSKTPTVLVLGGSILGKGMEALTLSSVELVDSDVSFGPRTKLISDSHDIPFQNESFDGVIVQAVLEHVVNPYQCVEEIHRVLKKDGIVYAETPFIQQVHGGCYDFHRFTHLGHRRLFRKFNEIESGSVCGPGMALAWSYQYFLLSFFKSKYFRKIIAVFTIFTSFFLKYFDYYLIDKTGTLDAASGYFFMGQKSCEVLSDKELIKSYRGLI